MYSINRDVPGIPLREPLLSERLDTLFTKNVQRQSIRDSMSSSVATTLPWAQIQTYITTLKNHDNKIAMLTKLKDEGLFDIKEVEINKITNSFIQLSETIDKTLRDHNIP